MDTIKVKFDDGAEYKLPDISSDKFDDHMWDTGANDIAYKKYLRANGMVELTDFNSESTSEITLIVEQPWRGRVLKFKCIYDSENDPEFNEEEYFKDNTEG